LLHIGLNEHFGRLFEPKILLFTIQAKLSDSGVAQHGIIRWSPSLIVW